MDERLKGWKVNSLSMAARHTLVSSVVAAIPSYAMQSTWLPKQTCDEIDKKCRNFLWGSTQTGRKPHMVAWEDVCQKKECGGLGLRHARKQNEAFMMKLGWGLVKRRDTLWVKFMREKYKCGNDVFPHIGNHRNSSQAWQGIRNTWDKLQKGVGWRLGNGQSINFWKDSWVPYHDNLLHYCTMAVPDSLKEEYVCDYITPSGGWNWAKFDSYLPTSVLEAIQQLAPLSHDEEVDVPIWKISPSGEFSIKTAYDLTSNVQPVTNRSLWNKVWKLHAPQRCKNFLWLAARGRLLTNSLRTRMGMQGLAACYSCGSYEDSLHVLRDCSLARCCWDKVLPTGKSHHFFMFNEVASWIKWNLSQRFEVSGVRWSVYFAILCRQLWINRNAGVFQDKAVGVIQIQAQAWAQARWSNCHLVSNTDPGTMKRAFWTAPFVGWIKINVDGAWCVGSHMAGCGGIARNHDTEVMGGFMFNIGRGSILHAEAWAIVMGLKKAWDSNWKKVVLETDCWEVLDLITNGWGEDHQEAMLLSEIISFLERDWEIHLEWCARDANSLADRLAKESLSIADGYFPFREAPDFLFEALRADATAPLV